MTTMIVTAIIRAILRSARGRDMRGRSIVASGLIPLTIKSKQNEFKGCMYKLLPIMYALCCAVCILLWWSWLTVVSVSIVLSVQKNKEEKRERESERERDDPTALILSNLTHLISLVVAGCVKRINRTFHNVIGRKTFLINNIVMTGA